jgi:hypothetical protein
MGNILEDHHILHVGRVGREARRIFLLPSHRRNRSWRALLASGRSCRKYNGLELLTCQCQFLETEYNDNGSSNLDDQGHFGKACSRRFRSEPRWRGSADSFRRYRRPKFWARRNYWGADHYYLGLVCYKSEPGRLTGITTVVH